MNASSEIQKKKNQASAITNGINWPVIAKDVLNFSLQLIATFLIGSRILFACKVAQANFLPTDLECMPYAPSNDKESPEYDDKEPRSNIDVMYKYDKDTDGYKVYSTKIAFQINEHTSSNGILDMIRRTEYDPKVDPMIKFICVVVKKIFAFNFSGISGLLNFMNSTLNESAIILIGAILLRYYVMIVYFISAIVAIILCITNAGWLMKSNKNNQKGYAHMKADKPVWRSCDPFYSWKNFFGTVLYLWVGLWISLGLSMSPIPAIIAIICVITPLVKKAKILDPTNPTKDLKDCETYTYMSSIKGMLETKLDLFMLLFCFNMIYTTYIRVSPTATVFVVIASILFLRATMQSKQVPRLATEGLFSYDKNEKKCPTVKLTQAEIDEISRDSKEEAEDDKKEEAEEREHSLLGMFTGSGPTCDAIPVAGESLGMGSEQAKAPPSLGSEPKVTATPETKVTITEPNGTATETNVTATPETKVTPSAEATLESESKQKGGARGDYLLYKIRKLTDTLKRRAK